MNVPDGYETSADFWTFADKLLAVHPLVIDRPRGCRHPRFPDFVYPLDYGYLDGTTAADGGRQVDKPLGRARRGR